MRKWLRKIVPLRPKSSQLVHRPAHFPLANPVDNTRRPLTSERLQTHSGSVLLSKLPLELRQIIWRQVLGGNRFHLEIYGGHARHTPCSSKEDCFHLGGRDGCERRRLSDAGKGPQLLALLLTCKQVYSEAVSFLYSDNLFITDDIRCIQYLPQLFLQQRIEVIRALRLHWDVGGMSAPGGITHLSASTDDLTRVESSTGWTLKWNEVWRAIAGMTSLERLDVSLMFMPNCDLPPNTMESILRPLKEITEPKTFTVRLGTVYGPIGDGWNTLPCDVVYQENQVVL